MDVIFVMAGFNVVVEDTGLVVFHLVLIEDVWQDEFADVNLATFSRLVPELSDFLDGGVVTCGGLRVYDPDVDGGSTPVS